MCDLGVCPDGCSSSSGSFMVNQALAIAHISVIMNTSSQASRWLAMLKWMLMIWCHRIPLILRVHNLSLVLINCLIKLPYIANELLLRISERVIVHRILPLVSFSCEHLSWHHTTSWIFSLQPPFLHTALMVGSDSFCWWWALDSNPIPIVKIVHLGLVVVCPPHFPLVTAVVLLLARDWNLIGIIALI